MCSLCLLRSLVLNYIYIRTSVSNTHAHMSVLRMKFKSYETEDFLARAVKVPVEVASSRLLIASFAFSSFSSKFVLDYASMERISIGSHYRASEVIPLILGVFKNKIERRGRQNKNNRPINLPNLPNVITFSTDFKYTTQ